MSSNSIDNYQPLEILSLLKTALSKLKGAKTPILISFIILFAFKIFIELLPFFNYSIILKVVKEALLYTLGSLFSIGISYIGIRRAFALTISYQNVLKAFRLKTAVYLIISQILTIVVPILLFHVSLLTHPLLAFIVAFPLLYLFIRLHMTQLLVIDKNLTPIQAIHESMLLTRGNVCKLILCVCCIVGITFLGIITLGIGFIWALPLIVLFEGEIYKTLLASAQKQLTASDSV